jgi:hypothetical protein
MRGYEHRVLALSSAARATNDSAFADGYAGDSLAFADLTGASLSSRLNRSGVDHHRIGLVEAARCAAPTVGE